MLIVNLAFPKKSRCGACICSSTTRQISVATLCTSRRNWLQLRTAVRGCGWACVPVPSMRLCKWSGHVLSPQTQISPPPVSALRGLLSQNLTSNCSPTDFACQWRGNTSAPIVSIKRGLLDTWRTVSAKAIIRSRCVQ